MPARRLRSAWRSFAFLSAIAAFSETAAAQPAFLVKDINTTEPAASSIAPGLSILLGYSRFAEHGGQLLFAANDGISGEELWMSDGTPGGTALVADILPGSASSNPDALTALPPGGLTLFGAAGTLYKTDGTPEGTGSLSNGNLHPVHLTPADGFIFFSGADSAVSELWKSDGTPDGTKKVQPAPPGSFGPSPLRMVMSGGTLLLSADKFPYGFELWKSDGTSSGTVIVKDIQSNGDSYPDQLTDVAGTLFFSAWTLESGNELWKSDGTPGGTVMVKDIWQGSNSSMVSEFLDHYTAAVGGTLFFTADDGTSGIELWKSDGTAAGTVMVKDIAPGTPGSSPFWLTRVGNQVYFAADDGAHGRELWVTDGTEAGTRMVEDIFPGTGDSLPQHLQPVGYTLLFSATDGTHGTEPWQSNGTAANTEMIQDIAPGALSSNPAYFTAAGSHVFFTANDNTTGHELWAVPRSAVLTTFGDVPTDFWAWSYVEALAAAGITTGCAPGLFCPEPTISRAETAAFLIRGSHGSGFVPPPATGAVFQDVPAGYWAASWIEQMFQDGLTTGCASAPPRFCPEQPLTRAEMAVFLLRAKHGDVYAPPAATGTVFSDVPAGYWAASWIEQLAAEGITTGCAPGLYCPEASVTRAQMAAFLTRTFSLPLP